MKNISDIFEKALKILGILEGGITNDPDDPGGPTAYGVTHATYDRYRKDKGKELRPVRFITPKEIREIYYTMYWLPAKCDQLGDPGLQIAHFCAVVNMGLRPGGKCLQRALCDIGQDIIVDGIIGKATMQALNNALATENHEELLIRYFYYQHARYVEIGERNAVWKKRFLAGLRNRILRTRKMIEDFKKGDDTK